MNGPWVVHLNRDKWDVRIDRATRFGNPFIIGKDGTRAEVLDKYEQWLIGRPALIKTIQHVLKDKILGCWCAPEGGLSPWAKKQVCHGQILARYANPELAPLTLL